MRATARPCAFRISGQKRFDNAYVRCGGDYSREAKASCTKQSSILGLSALATSLSRHQHHEIHILGIIRRIARRNDGFNNQQAAIDRHHTPAIA